ncbi:MAG: RDD family protein [Candidatus Berkiella sp.]
MFTNTLINTSSHLPASVFRRLAALVYDAFIVFSLAILATAFALILNEGQSFQNVQYLFLSYLFIVIASFLTWFWQRSGQTLGMLSWKIKVVQANLKPLTWKKAWLRLLVAIPLSLLFGITWLWCFFDKQKQSLHDRICGTQVLHYNHLSKKGKTR